MMRCAAELSTTMVIIPVAGYNDGEHGTFRAGWCHKVEGRELFFVALIERYPLEKRIYSSAILFRGNIMPRLQNLEGYERSGSRRLSEAQVE